MEELLLTKELFIDIVNWMRSKYAMSTIKARASFLKMLFKKYKVLNRSTLKQMNKSFRYQHQRAAITTVNNFCYDNDIDFNIRVPSVKTQAKKLPDIFSPVEIKLIVEAAPKPYDLAIRCIFNVGAGLRVSEIIKMSWNHIHWADWIKNKEHYGIASIKSGKGSKDRIVNIPKQLMLDLYTYAKEKKVLNEFGIPTGGMIFPFDLETQTKIYKKDLLNTDIERWKDMYVKSRYDWFRHNIIKKYCEKALNKKIKVHLLRHSRATYLHVIEGVPIEQIQILLGHASMNTTMIYTRINPKQVFDNLKETKEI